VTVNGKSVSGQANNPEPVGWPDLDEAAFYGLPGDVVRTFLEPHTEADPERYWLTCCAPSATSQAAAHSPVWGRQSTI
jgi:hypothetical protein